VLTYALNEKEFGWIDMAICFSCLSWDIWLKCQVLYKLLASTQTQMGMANMHLSAQRNLASNQKPTLKCYCQVITVSVFFPTDYARKSRVVNLVHDN
jgi:hypothetical protein